MNRSRFLIFTLGVFVAAAGLPVGLSGFGFGDLTDAVKNAANSDTLKNGAKMAKGYAGIGPEEERSIGGSVAVQIAGKYGGLVRDEAITKRVNLIGRTLAGCSDRPNLRWRFGVLNSDTINAFSAPSGYVFITRGLYALAADDDQLAGILAHEIAHITERHALKIVERSEFLDGASGFAAQRSSTVRATQAQVQKFDLGIDKIVDTLMKIGFDPKTEYEADRIGRDLAAMAGYSRDGLRQVLQKLQQDNLASSQEVFSTHPPLAERIRRL